MSFVKRKYFTYLKLTPVFHIPRLPSGSGKSSLLRVMAGLWPISSGSVHRPPSCVIQNGLGGGGGVLFVPQTTYLTEGSLREQLIYPHSLQQQRCDDDVLLQILGDVQLRYMRSGICRKALIGFAQVSLILIVLQLFV